MGTNPDSGAWWYMPSKRSALEVSVMPHADLWTYRRDLQGTRRKDQIKDSPEFEPTRFDEDYWTRPGTYFEPFVP
jgi:hypothetical protein